MGELTLRKVTSIVAPASEPELCDWKEWHEAEETARAVLLYLADWLEDDLSIPECFDSACTEIAGRLREIAGDEGARRTRAFAE